MNVLGALLLALPLAWASTRGLRWIMAHSKQPIGLNDQVSFALMGGGLAGFGIGALLAGDGPAWGFALGIGAGIHLGILPRGGADEGRWRWLPTASFGLSGFMGMVIGTALGTF